jgi:hypothetical protein
MASAPTEVETRFHINKSYCIMTRDDQLELYQSIYVVDEFQLILRTEIFILEGINSTLIQITIILILSASAAHSLLHMYFISFFVNLGYNGWD